MRNLLLILCSVAVLGAGCSAVEHAEHPVGSTSWHQEQLSQITDSLNKGEISQQQFDEMKSAIDQRNLKWKAGARRGIRLP